MTTPAYTGPARVWEMTRTPSTRPGGVKVWSSSTGDITTTPALLYYIKCITGGSVTLKDGGSGGTTLWQGEATEFQHFDDPIEFPNGMHATVAGTVYIGYKD